MGKAMEQGPKQELVPLQIISPELIVISSDQKAMGGQHVPSCEMGCRLWCSPRQGASVRCRRVKPGVSEADSAICLSYLFVLHKGLGENVLLDVTWGILALAQDWYRCSQ